MAAANGSGAVLAAMEDDEGMQAAAGIDEAADLGAYLPPTPTDAAALTATG